MNLGDFFLRFRQRAGMGWAQRQQVCSTHHVIEQRGWWEAPVEVAISSPAIPFRHLCSRVTTYKRILLFLCRAIARRITSLPPRDRFRTRWRISGGWCGNGSATPLLCSQKFKRGSRYVSHGCQLRSKAVAVNACKIWALILEKLFAAYKF